MTKTSLICGSLAFDSIMQFDGRFAEAMAGQTHRFNLAFLVPTMRREFGGCAGNIAYNLKMLGGDARIMGTLGSDGGVYLDRLEQLDISRQNITTISASYTAQAFISTDADNNQITAFHPGAMNFSHHNKISDAGAVKLAIVAPDGRDGMLQHAADCFELKVPFIFDPGQGLPMFNGDELKHFIDLSTYVAVNDYEIDLLTERTGLSIDGIAARVEALIVTRGAEGADIHTKGEKIAIPCVPAERVVDPTGCGDAFRAGLMYGITHDLDWATTGRIGSLMGSIKIAHQGGQNHVLTRAEIEERFMQAFGYRF